MMLLRRKQNNTLRLAEKARKVYMHAETFSEFLIQSVQNHLKTYKEEVNENQYEQSGPNV